MRDISMLMECIAKRCPHRKLPDSYLVFDTETSGTNVSKDRILQFGFVLVKNKKIVDEFSFLAKRTKEEVLIEEGAIRVHGITYEKLAAEGVPADQIINDTIAIFESARSSGMLFVGHNMYSFDAPMFERECLLNNKQFRFGDNEIIDTGMIVKAAQMSVPFDDQWTMRDWAKRIADIRARGIFWSLDRYCIPTFGLNKFGPFKSHDAQGDCQATHHLLEVLRQWPKTQ